MSKFQVSLMFPSFQEASLMLVGPDPVGVPFGLSALCCGFFLLACVGRDWVLHGSQSIVCGQLSSTSELFRFLLFCCWSLVEPLFSEWSMVHLKGNFFFLYHFSLLSGELSIVLSPPYFQKGRCMSIFVFGKNKICFQWESWRDRRN